MKYAYEDLSHSQFETLAVFLCQELFGISVQGFAEGPDGGRDAKFVGTANLFPSAAAPWVGTTIIQAKHTNAPNRRFSDSDFFSATSEATVVGKELGRIKRLRASKELDHYVLFSNRKLGGEAEAGIRNHISTTCGIPVGSVYLCGIEGLEAFLKVTVRKRIPRKVLRKSASCVARCELKQVESLRSGVRIYADFLVPGGFHRWGSNSSIRFAGWVWTRIRTSVRYAIGLTPFISHDATSV